MFGFNGETSFTKAIRKLGQVSDDQLVNQLHKVFSKTQSMHWGSELIVAHGTLSALEAAFPEAKSQAVIKELKKALKARAIQIARQPYGQNFRFERAAENQALRTVFGDEIMLIDPNRI